MTKSKTSKAGTEAFNAFTGAFDDLGAHVQVPEGTRDFVRRQAGTASERAEQMHAQAWKAAEQAKPLFGPFAQNYATATRTMLDATLANTQHYFATISKLADANSFGDAVRIQSDYVQESLAANAERFRKGGEQAQAIMADTAKVARENFKTAA